MSTRRIRISWSRTVLASLRWFHKLGLLAVVPLLAVLAFPSMLIDNHHMSSGRQGIPDSQQQIPAMFFGAQQPQQGQMGMQPNMSMMFQQQQVPQGQMQMQQQNNVSAEQQSLNISNEIKRLQNLHQLGGQNQGLLLPPASNLPTNDASTALLQSMLDPKATTGRLEDAFLQNLNNTSPMLQPAFLQDARLFMAQNQLNPIQPGGRSEMPLPSPHSLFHRDGTRRMRGGVIEPFPEKLHRLLLEVEAAGRSDVISFVAGGRAFAIHKPDKFFKEIVPLYFRQSRLSSFKRQLNLYGFELINTGPARGGYFHELFVKERPELCRRMRRVAVKVSANKQDKEDEGEGKHEPGLPGDSVV